MTKIIKIDKCYQCPRFMTTGVDVKGQDGVCRLMNYKPVHNDNIIPWWCPLDDK